MQEILGMKAEHLRRVERMKGAWKGLFPSLLIAFAVLLGIGGRTASAGQPFFFIQLTDPQFGMFANNVEFTQETANLEFAVAAINRLRPAFVVVTGDLVEAPGNPEQIAEYKRIMAKVNGIPVYSLPGNHDVGAVPTQETISAYTNQLGPTYYSFRHNGLVGIVLDSNLIKAPDKVRALRDRQEHWLKRELQRARDEGAAHIVVFQHHSWFLESADEKDQYFNLPLESRKQYLPMLRDAGVKHVFCGHLHRNLIARDGDLEVVTTAPVGKPLGENSKSGLRVVFVRGDRLEHRFYDFGELPHKIILPVE
jgi:serine/threonine-protein phosphatase CPPED1